MMGLAALSSLITLITPIRESSHQVWRCGADGEWTEEMVLPPLHTDWVRDVAWAPTVGIGGGAVIASCAQDRKVVVWTEANAQWTPKVIELPAAVWSVSWSVTGGILAAAAGDNQVTLWKETALGDWVRIGQLSEQHGAQPAQ